MEGGRLGKCESAGKKKTAKEKIKNKNLPHKTRLKALVKNLLFKKWAFVPPGRVLVFVGWRAYSPSLCQM